MGTGRINAFFIFSFCVKSKNSASIVNGEVKIAIGTLVNMDKIYFECMRISMKDTAVQISGRPNLWVLRLFAIWTDFSIFENQVPVLNCCPN